LSDPAGRAYKGGVMLSLEELRGVMKGEVLVQQELADHDVKKVAGHTDLLVKPANGKELKKILHIFRKSHFPHVMIDRKGRVHFPDNRFHGAVILID